MITEKRWLGIGAISAINSASIDSKFEAATRETQTEVQAAGRLVAPSNTGEARFECIEVGTVDS